MKEISWKTDGFQFRQLGFLYRRQVVLLEDLVLWGQSCNEIQKPALVRHVRFINTTKDKVLVSTDTMKLLEQHFNCGWARTRKHLDLRILWTIGFSQKNISHVIFGDHCCLILRKVIPVSLNSFIKIFTVLYDAGEVIHRHLHVVV